MTTPKTSARGVELTAIDTDGHRHVCRLIVHGKHIKYAVVYDDDFGVKPPGKLTNYSGDIPFPIPPGGDWRVKQIVKDEQTEQPKFVDPKTEDQTALRPRGARNAGHPTRIDYFDEDLETVRRGIKGVEVIGRNDQLRLVTHPALAGGKKPVLMKTIDFPFPRERHYLEVETQAYRVLAGQDITPEFLGHVTAEGLVIGFFLEWVDAGTGGYNRSEHPGLEDERRCLDAVDRLHSLGIVHGDLHSGNMLWRTGRASEYPGIIFIDFETAKFTEDPSAREKDIDRLVRRWHGDWSLGIDDVHLEDLHLGDSTSSIDVETFISVVAG